MEAARLSWHSTIQDLSSLNLGRNSQKSRWAVESAGGRLHFVPTCWTPDPRPCKYLRPAMPAAGLLAHSATPPPVRFNRAWLAYAMGWFALAVFWSLASALSIGRSPRFTLPFGLLVMGVAGTMGLGVWWLTGRVRWDRHSPAFYTMHAACALAYAAIYSCAGIIPDLAIGRFGVFTALLKSPVLGWNMLMGSWLYLIVAGL
jgi:hypothetical protein